MKKLVRILGMLVLACSLQQCDDSANTDLKPAYDDLPTSAQSKKGPFTLTANMSESSPPYQFLMYLFGTDGEISVDWGDGTNDVYELGSELAKLYPAAERYRVSITGDLKKIDGFKAYYGDGVFDSADFSSLTRLERVNIGLMSGPHTLDFSNNSYLHTLFLTGVEALTEIVLPKKHFISSASISGPNNLSPAMVDYIINSIYQNAIKGKIFNGYFNVQESWFYDDPEDENNLVGPPSASSIDKLRILRDVYGWEIRPIIE